MRSNNNNNNNNNNDNNDIEQQLIEIISFEIYKDGGASLVRDLKDYHSKIDSLLKRSCSSSSSSNSNSSNNSSSARTTNKSSKLLRFLEQYPEIFEVDRTSLPHIVYLASTDQWDSTRIVEQQQQQQQQDQQSKHVKEVMKDKIICILKKEKSKDDRRHKSNISDNGDLNNENDGGFVNNNNNTCVNIFWLQKQCKSQLHHYLRSSLSSSSSSSNNDYPHNNYYYYQQLYSNCKDVKLVGSNEWIDLVADKFHLVIEEMECCEYVIGRDGKRRVSLLSVNNNDYDKDGASTRGVDGDGNGNCKGDDKDNDIQTIANQIIEKVEEDGGTHISLPLLLHRYPKLQKILSGHDILDMKQRYEHYFQGITIFVKNDIIYLQSKKAIIPNEYHNEFDNGDSGGGGQRRRMEVDETGLFSVASSKWGKTFTSMMVKHCQRTLHTRPEETIAIDLTSSVGGVTLPLAKVFRKVIAVEMDHRRSVLCQRNMVRFDVSDKVEIINDDSIEIIPLIASQHIDFVPEQGQEQIEQQQQQRPKVCIVDPPWGGMYYKHDKEIEIVMGKWTMVEVVQRITQYLSPTIIGLRMPLSFKYEFFYNSLRSAGIIFESLETRKAGPQLFIMLSV